MALTSERLRVIRRMEKAEDLLQREVRERDGSPEARTRYLAARREHDLADAEARLLLTIIANDR